MIGLLWLLNLRTEKDVANRYRELYIQDFGTELLRVHVSFQQGVDC